MNQEHKVDFMVVGAQKCGTSSLASILSSHSSVVGCNEKEPMFFSSVENWERQIADYHSLYNWTEGALHFEASTSYTCYPHHNLKIWEALYAYNPDLKIIYIVRDPVERVISSYMHSFKRGYIDLDIERAITEEPILLDMTRYVTQIKPFIDQFGPQQVQILFFEDLVKDRNIIINQLCSFLKIAPDGFPNVENVHANKSVDNFKIHHKYDHPGFILGTVKKYLPPAWKIITDNSARSFKKKPELSHQDQEMILYLLRNEIEELEEMTGRDLNSWREIKKVEKVENRYEYHLTWYEARMNLLNRIKNKLTG